MIIDRHGGVQFKCFENLGKYLTDKFINFRDLML